MLVDSNTTDIHSLSFTYYLFSPLVITLVGLGNLPGGRPSSLEAISMSFSIYS